MSSPTFSRDPESPEGRARASARTVVMRPRADTRQVAALQLLPLLPVVLSMASVLGARGWTWMAVVGSVITGCVIQYLVARADVAALGRRGFVEQAPAVLALLSSALYLRVRADRCDGHDASARDAVGWAVGTTVASGAILLLGTLFQFAVSSIFEAVNNQ